MNTATAVEPAKIYIPSCDTVESFAGVLNWATQILNDAQKYDALFDGPSTVLAGLDETEVLDNLDALEQSLIGVFETLNGTALRLDERGELDSESQHFYERFRETFEKFHGRVKRLRHSLENFATFELEAGLYIPA